MRLGRLRRSASPYDLLRRGFVGTSAWGPSQPRPARESRRGFAHRFDLSTLPRFTRLRRAPRLMHGETPFTAYQQRVGSQAGARGSSSLPRSGRTAVTGLSSPAGAARALRPLVLSAGSCAPGVSRLLPPPRRTHPPSRATRQQMMHVRSRCMCPSRARVFGVPASPYRLRLRPCLGSRVVERVVCGAGLSLGCLTGLVRSAVGGPSQPRPARESRRGFATGIHLWL